MTDELRLPPRRELPPEVRDRMRATVTRGLARRPQRGRMLAAAAAVVVFVVGAVVVTQSARTPRTAPVAVAPSPSPDNVLNRCWAAVKLSGKTGVPDLSTWVEVNTGQDGDDTVLAFTAAGKPMFCETTATTVTLSDPAATPAYAPGTRTALLLYTDTGLVAGIADPAWPGVALSIADGPGIAAVDVAGPSRQFTSFTGTSPATTRIVAQKWVDGQDLTAPDNVLPAPPAPLFSIVDRPAEKSSPAGKALASCLNHVSRPPADRDAYAPGALLTDGKYQVVLGRSPGHTVACVTEPDPAHPVTSRYQLYLDTFVGESIPVRRLSVPGLGPNAAKVPFVGIAPYAAAFLDVDFGLGGSVNIPVTHGTFAIWLPASARPESDGNVHVDAMGGNRTGLFNGGIPMR